MSFQEVTEATVSAVSALLAATKDERSKRGKYFKYSQQQKEEIATYALVNITYYVAVSQIIHASVMSINCRYSAAQMCTREDTLIGTSQHTYRSLSTANIPLHKCAFGKIHMLTDQQNKQQSRLYNLWHSFCSFSYSRVCSYSIIVSSDVIYCRRKM